jgi:hypothetical protein
VEERRSFLRKNRNLNHGLKPEEIEGSNHGPRVKTGFHGLKPMEIEGRYQGARVKTGLHGLKHMEIEGANHGHLISRKLFGIGFIDDSLGKGRSRQYHKQFFVISP